MSDPNFLKGTANVGLVLGESNTSISGARGLRASCRNRSAPSPSPWKVRVMVKLACGNKAVILLIPIARLRLPCSSCHAKSTFIVCVRAAQR